MKIYLAGKISKNDWRTELTTDTMPCDVRDWRKLKALPLVADVGVTTGPFFIRCDHGCNHGENTHATTSGCVEGVTPQEVFEKSLEGIERADVVFAYAGLDFADAHGTHTELGAARAMGKFVILVVHPKLDRKDLWFPVNAANLIIESGYPVAVFRNLWGAKTSLATLKKRSYFVHAIHDFEPVAIDNTRKFDGEL